MTTTRVLGIETVYLNLSDLTIQQLAEVQRVTGIAKNTTELYLEAENFKYLYRFNSQWDRSRIKSQVTMVLNRKEVSYTTFLELVEKANKRVLR